MTGAAKTPLAVQNAGQIDLDSHAVIEASAGTGKTYAIAEMVVSLLRQGRVQGLDEVLVVTFTEKAAGELKDRIRKIITESLRKAPSDTLQASLDNFDSASIYTIHGFCNKILSEYAFENRTQFRNELTDDREVYQDSLRRIMRERWPDRFGDRLTEILRLSGFPDISGDGVSRWEERVIELALRYQPSGGDVLMPSPDADLLKAILEMDKACGEHMDTLSRLTGPIDENDVAMSELCARYAALDIRKNSMNKRLRILASVLGLVLTHREKRISSMEAALGIDVHDIGENGYRELMITKQGTDYREKLPELENIVELLERLRAMDFGQLKNMLAASAVSEIKEISAEYKSTRGLLSYDDMISRVLAALAEKNENLARIVRNRYLYAFVDEFQDTDLSQWRIFKTIFLAGGRHRLFIISDPKQAIYGFRGADVNAYYVAREEMTGFFGARYYGLTKNWRSSKKLIGIYNRVFGSGVWFAESDIAYLPSQYPEEHEKSGNRSGDSLFVIDCGACTGTEAKFRTAEYIAAEIGRLSGGSGRIAPDQIAILVKKWSEADAVEKSLKKTGIRYSYYKKEGLFQSKEALEILYLLSAIASPNDAAARRKSLATRFFGVPVHALARFDEAPADHPISAIFRQWDSFADGKNWAHLFQSIMEDTGILCRTDIAGLDRAILNYRSIIQHVTIEAMKKNYGIHETVDFLNKKRMQGVPAYESHNLETINIENPGVQIMTIHASKGLQFRAVFIAGGFTRKDVSEFWTYHWKGKRVFDLVQAKTNKDLHNREVSGDEERLFYVAFTRAEERVYVPVFQPTRASRNSSGILGGKLASALESIKGEEGVLWLDYRSNKSQGLENISGPPGRVKAISLPDPLFYGHDTGFLERMMPVDSFSGLKLKLTKQAADEKTSVEFAYEPLQSGEDDVSLIVETEGGLQVEQAMRELPYGPETGLLLHDVLERIDFHFVGQATGYNELLAAVSESGKIITDAVHSHLSLPNNDSVEFIKHETARIVWNTLRASLDGGGFSLCKANRIIREAEFFYPAKFKEHNAIPEISRPDGYLHGFIDLIFAYEDRFYIADWKSNYLEQGYAPAELENNIKFMRYDLQIVLYSAALIRWLKLNLPGYSYDVHFGGVYYLYLRGMDPGAPAQGVYFYRPDREREIMYASSP